MHIEKHERLERRAKGWQGAARDSAKMARLHLWAAMLDPSIPGVKADICWYQERAAYQASRAMLATIAAINARRSFQLDVVDVLDALEAAERAAWLRRLGDEGCFDE